MPTINNSDLSKEMIDGAKLAINLGVPNQLAEKVVPVMEVNPKLLRRVNFVRNASSVVTGTITLLTTPSDQDFYISEINASLIKDANCDVATGAVTISTTIDGATRTLLGLATISLTAQNQTAVVPFPMPIKLDRGVTITMNGTYTAGVMSRIVCLAGYTIPNSNV